MACVMSLLTALACEATAQSKAERKPSDENNRAFEAALQKLVAYRASVEADNVCDFGHAAFQGKNDCCWKHEF